MKIGFLNNQIDNRGTGNAVYNYADYNESILENESVIYTFRSGMHDADAFEKFFKRFGAVNFIDEWDSKVDALYHIKSGRNDFPIPTVPYLVHAVFEVEPHGSRYATISEWMAEKYDIPFVPHIVKLPNVDADLRQAFGIPSDAIVFGRHGGNDTFDISFAWESVNEALKANPHIYFLFMNTDVPSLEFYDGNRVGFIGPSVNDYQKRAFINTCNAMIHARSRGETFGIAVGEFAICNKPIITYGLSQERAHLKELGTLAITYYDQASLTERLLRFAEAPHLAIGGYSGFDPITVMGNFNEVFLNGTNSGD